MGNAQKRLSNYERITNNDEGDEEVFLRDGKNVEKTTGDGQNYLEVSDAIDDYNSVIVLQRTDADPNIEQGANIVKPTTNYGAIKPSLDQVQTENEVKSDNNVDKNSASVCAVEMMFLLFKIGESILEPTVRLYLYESVCLNLYPNGEHHYVCEHLKADRSKEHDTQNMAAKYMLYYKILINFPAMVVVLCCGAWSDSSGRTTPIILTCLGTVLAVLAYMISSIDIFHGTPSLPVILLGAGIRGLFGRSAIMTMAVNSYVSDNSQVDVRTQRLSNLAAMSHFGYLVGSSSAGFLLDRCGFSTVFLIVIVIDTVCVLVAYSCMQNKSQKESSVFGNMLHGREESPEEKRPLLLGSPERSRSKSHRCHTISTSEDLIIIQVPNDHDTPICGSRQNTQCRKIDFNRVPPSLLTLSLPINDTSLLNDFAKGGKQISEIQRTTCQSVDFDCYKAITIPQRESVNNDDFKEISYQIDCPNFKVEIPIDKADKIPKTVIHTIVEDNPDKTEAVTVCNVDKKPTTLAGSLLSSFQVLFRKRPGRLRYNMLVLFLIIYLHQMNKSGDTDIYLLFTKRSPLSVSRSLYGYLLSVNYACLGLFAFFVPKFFNLINFRVKDSTLAMVGIIFRLACLILLFFSKHVWMLLLAAVLSGPHSLTVSTVKSMVSKIASSGEMGKTFSLMSSGETLSNLIGTLFYTSIYSITSSIHPGICFLIEAGVYGFIFILILQLAIDARRSNESVDSEKKVSSDRIEEIGENSRSSNCSNENGDGLIEKSISVLGVIKQNKNHDYTKDYDVTPKDARQQALFTTPHN